MANTAKQSDRKYEIFLAVALEKSVSVAAQKLGLTQSAVSHTLKRMEEETGLTLFIYRKNGMQLTKEGEQLLPAIKSIVSSKEQLTQTINELHDVHRGNLTIGTFPSISIHWLPQVMRAFLQDYPEIRIHLKEGGTEDIENWIYDRSVDIGFLSTRPGDSFDWIPLKKDPLLAVLPKDYSLRGKKVFRLNEFNHQPFIMSDLGTDFDIHRVIDEFSLEPDVRFSSKDDYAIISMVAGGLGLSILPELMLKHHDEGVVTLPLEPAQQRQLGIGLASKQQASPAAKMFIKYAKEIILNDDK